MRGIFFVFLLVLVGVMFCANATGITEKIFAEANEIVYHIYNGDSDDLIWTINHRDLTDIEAISTESVMALPDIEDGIYYLEIIVDGERFGDRIPFTSISDIEEMITMGHYSDIPDDTGEILDDPPMLTIQGPCPPAHTPGPTSILGDLIIGGACSERPEAALDVVGQVRIRGGSPGVNRVLTSDADGYATWEDISGVSENNYVSGISFNTGTGILTLERHGLSSLTQNLDGRYLTSFSETDPTWSGVVNTTGNISRSGNVGLGIASPTSLLHLLTTSSTMDDLITLQSNGGASAGTAIKFQTGATVVAGRIKVSPSTVIWDSRMDFDVSWGTGAGDNTFTAMSLLGRVSPGGPTGYVGIGTTSPTQRLDVNGTIRLRNHLFDQANTSGTEGQVLTRGASGVRWQDATAGGDNNYVSGMSFNTGTGVLTLNREGLSSLTQNLDGRYLTSFSETDPTWDGVVNTTGNIGRTGNVGIGTSSPSYNLHVNGTAYATQFRLPSGGIIRSNGIWDMEYYLPSGDHWYSWFFGATERFRIHATGFRPVVAGNNVLGHEAVPWTEFYLTGELFADGSSGTAGQVLTSDGSGSVHWSDAGAGGSCNWTLSGSNVYRTAGNVGIGTSSPTNGRLVVSYASTDIYGIYVTMPGWAIYGDASGGGGRGVMGRGGEVGVRGECLGSSATWGALGYTSGASDYYAGYFEGNVHVNGNLGIGTTNPFMPLEVVRTATGGDAALLQLRNNSTASNSSATLSFLSSTTASSSWGASQITSIRDGNNTHFSFKTSTAGTINERMRIRHDGNVGIGTDNPWAKLTVQDGRLVVQNTAGYSSGGSGWYTNNPWLYLSCRETDLAAGQGGNIIFSAMSDATTSADLAMIAGVRENALNDNWASRLRFFTRPAGENIEERLNIDSQGHFTFIPTNASGRTILINDLGLGGGGSEPTIVPSSHHFGFIGTAARAWWRVHAHELVTTSSREWKTNVELLSQQERAEMFSDFKELDVVSYNLIRHKTDSLENIISTEELDRTFGLISEDSPEYIAGEDGKGIKLYEYITMLTVALQESIAKIDALEKIIYENGLADKSTETAKSDAIAEQNELIKQLMHRMEQLENN